MNERYIKWYTPWLGREFEMLAFGNDGGLPLIIFPTSFGSYYQSKDFGLVGQSPAMSMLAKSPFIARTRSIWKVSTTRKFIRPIE
jgi:esterase/lipase superfamily enzyme